VAALAGLGPVHLLLTGANAAAAAPAAAAVAGVEAVLVAEDAAHAVPAVEALAAMVVGMADSYSHIAAPASATGKNLMPRVAALLDVQQIFGRAGRPQFDSSGEGIIITANERLPHYLSVRQVLALLAARPRLGTP
jgi:hypothetical protein